MGVILVDGVPRWVTVERPWLDNVREASCIPEGKYIAVRALDYPLRNGVVLPLTWVLQDVPGRSGICFHPGNSMMDTLGCIVVATWFGEGKVEESRKAFKGFVKEFSQCAKLSVLVRHA